MNIISKIFQILTLIVFTQQATFSQTCPSVNAQVGTGASTTICSGLCANLTASVVPVNSTTTYTVGSTPYSPFPFSGGTAAISNVADDLWSTPINIGFNFCYFGNTFNQLLVGANGEITFSVTTAVESWTISSVLPNLIDHPGNTICGPYRDINPSDVSSSINYYTTGTAPCRSFVIYWDDAPLVSCITPKSTFQIVLHENTNIIDVFIENSTACAAWQGGKGLIGIQNATGTTAIAPAGRNVLTTWTAINEAWRFTPTGVPNYTVNWAGPSGFTATGLTAAPCPTATSNYTATMNVANCGGGSSSYTSAVQVSVTPTPTISPVASPTAICIGNSSTLTASGASSYTWNPGAITGSSLVVTPTTTTIYTVTGINGSCTSTQTISLRVNNNPTVTATRSPSLICGTGSSTLTGSGAFTYTWNPGALTGTSVIVTPTATTIYTVIGTSTLGCTGTRTLNVNVSPSPTITASSSATLVCSNSTVSLTGSGGTSYTWTPGPRVGTTVVVTPTANTTYTVRGRNAAGCIDTETITINVTPGITVTPVASPTVICSGSSSTLTVSGATTYTWNPGALTGATVVVTPTINTTYSVTGVDVSGCSNTKTITVAVRTPTINATKSPTIVCLGNSATITATGASTYTWNPGSITGNTIVVTPTITTIYTVTGTNTLGCIGTRTVSMPVSSNPTVTAASTNTAICIGSTTTLTASGATSYTWMPGALAGTTAVVSPTTNTTYTVTGRNISGCISTGTIDITVNPSVTITPSASPTIICRGNSSTLTATGANSYTWNPGALTGSNVIVSPTVTTTYSITGTATTGCVGATTLSVNVSTISVNATSNPTIICSSSSATLTGTGASTYTWEPGSLSGNTVVVTPTATTIYTLTGTNTVGCTATRTLNLVVGVTPTITASASSTLICAGTTVTLTTSGAVTYTWLPGSIVGATITRAPIISTTYTVNGRNASGCIGTNTVFVSVNPNPTLTAISNPTVICSGSPSTLTANGALTYTWNPGGVITSSVIVTPTITTAYTVVATSSLGCTGSSTVNLKVNPIPNITATSSSTAICSGLSATLTGNGAITYTWNPGVLTGSNVIVSPTISTIYTVTGTNNGCSNSNTISITVNANPTINTVGAPPNVCPGNTSTLSAMGAVTYTWMPGSLIGTPVTVNPTVTTTYSVTGTDVNGCIDTETVTINTFPTPSITATSNPTVLCNGGSATLTATGGSSYDWEPGSLNGASVVVTPTSTTVYTVTGHTVPGCISTATVSLTINPNPTVTATSNPTVICAGATATLTGVGAATYTWNPGALTGTTVAVTPTITTTYTVDGDNGTGCVSTETVTVNVNTAPSVSVVATSTTLCSAGSVTLTASGGTTYTWSPVAANTASIVDSPTITTTYTVDSDNGTGCIASQTIIINVSSNPTITISASPIGTICVGTTATLTASGASTYTWNPGALSGTSITDAPIITTTYTVDGDNGFGCISTNTFVLDVAPGASITAIANPTTICANTTVSLSAIGANTYTWMPLGTSGSSVIATPSISTTYTVLGDNGTCVASATVDVDVTPGPANITASASGSLTCIGDVTLTSSSTSTNTLNYSWNGPSSFTATIQSPTTTIAGDYTVTVNDALTGCSSTTTLTVGSNTTIPNLTATTSGSVECIGSVTITATSTSTNTLNYDWSGPLSFTAAIQSPTTNIAGDYSVTVSDATTGCSSSTILTVGSNTVIPNLIATTSGSLGCAVTVTITATSTSSNTLSYDWTGPLSFTASIQNPTTNIAGDYTVTVNDALTGCTGNTTLTVGSSTIAPTYTAAIIAATCSGTIANNDGTIILTGFGTNDNYDFVQANTYTGTVDYASATSIPTTGVITNSLVNPGIAAPYTIRVFSANGCFTDATLTLTPTTCSITNINVLGMTKAVSTPTYINNNAYNVTYTIVAVNTSSVDLTNFSIIDNLNNTFPLPTTYGIISSPFIISLNSSLTINPTYNGSSQSNMLAPSSSTLVAGKRDTIVFTVQINPNGFFGPYNNSAVGFGTDNNNIIVSDSSNTGFNWDPDNDGDPTNNDTATVVILNPNSSIGIAKSGSLSEVLADKTIDITYVFNVKNLGNDTIKLVQVLDDLIISSPAQFTIKSGPTASSGLTANSNYNGLSDNALLVTGKLVPGAIETITLVINVTPNEITSITNIAIVTGVGADGGIVIDTSNAGIEPDANGNGDATEQGENNPTILELPNVELFIPEVFTPDGDGKNDFFVINGISGKTVKITVFNRWGNKVYENNAYDNTWNGIPNVSGVIGGSNKLPQGTYYYIAEFEDENDKPINGFVVLQY